MTDVVSIDEASVVGAGAAGAGATDVLDGTTGVVASVDVTGAAGFGGTSQLRPVQHLIDLHLVTTDTTALPASCPIAMSLLPRDH